ncbi:hypothetical protein C5167_021019 [Papaver somniferum]|uniref:Plant heme peroxidase family profile domain-containing protein n=1 Tax=Papaver somniferum TaxID=3469 RepID=A0A4Y7IY10_PAPSO|nr:hypothetical protein C5167_021019 [Papaver somniferum]
MPSNLSEKIRPAKSACNQKTSLIHSEGSIMAKLNSLRSLKKILAKLQVCFVSISVTGCDGSVLLDGSASGPSEKNAPPNLSLRAQAFKIINDLRSRIHKACGHVVSCADITALAARDAVLLCNYTVLGY